jgi:hypothetical protein
MIKNVIVNSEYTEVVASANAIIANLGIYFCNTDRKNADVIDIFVMPSGSVPEDLTSVISRLYIPPGETFMFGDEKFILDAGESIGAKAQVGGRISATVTYTNV